MLKTRGCYGKALPGDPIQQEWLAKTKRFFTRLTMLGFTTPSTPEGLPHHPLLETLGL